jgi:hypothetical protein
MQAFFSDYGSLIGSTAAIINGFIAVVVAQFFKDRPAARVLLALAAGVLGGAAIGATLLGQHEAIIQKPPSRLVQDDRGESADVRLAASRQAQQVRRLR